MPAVSHARKLIAILCLAVLLVTAMTPGAHSLPALLAPFWLFLEILAVVRVGGRGEDPALPLSSPVAVPASRAPPVQ